MMGKFPNENILVLGATHCLRVKRRRAEQDEETSHHLEPEEKNGICLLHLSVFEQSIHPCDDAHLLSGSN